MGFTGNREYQKRPDVYLDQDVLTFYGFGGSDTRTLIYSYNVKTGTESHNATYVLATASHITIADGQSMTCTRWET